MQATVYLNDAYLACECPYWIPFVLSDNDDDDADGNKLHNVINFCTILAQH